MRVQLRCCPLWGVGVLGRWPPGWGRKLVSRTEEFQDASVPRFRQEDSRMNWAIVLLVIVGRRAPASRLGSMFLASSLCIIGAYAQGAADFFLQQLPPVICRLFPHIPRRLENAVGFHSHYFLSFYYRVDPSDISNTMADRQYWLHIQDQKSETESSECLPMVIQVGSRKPGLEVRSF